MRLDFNRALVGAALVHLLIGAALHARLVRGDVVDARAADRTVELDLEAPASEVAAPPATELPVLAPPVSVAARRLLASSTSRALPSPSPAPVDETGSLGEKPGVPTTNDDATWTFSPRVKESGADKPVELGLRTGGSPMSSEVLRAAGTESRSDRAALESVQQALDGHDREVGLGAGGPLVNVTRDAVRESLAPSIGHALFEFRTDSAGLVLSVRLLDASSDRSGWSDAAEKLAERIKREPLRLKKKGDGPVAVKMEVASVVRKKSGHDVGETQLSVLGVPIKRSNAEHPVAVDLSIPIISGNIDPTDLLMDAMSKPERIVSVRVVDERRL